MDYDKLLTKCLPFLRWIGRRYLWYRNARARLSSWWFYRKQSTRQRFRRGICWYRGHNTDPGRLSDGSERACSVRFTSEGIRYRCGYCWQYVDATHKPKKGST